MSEDSSKSNEVQRLEAQIGNLQELLNKSVDADDTTRVMSLIRLQGQVQKQLDEARLKSGQYLDVEALKDWVEDFVSRMSKCRAGIIEDGPWNTFVDKFLGLGGNDGT